MTALSEELGLFVFEHELLEFSSTSKNISAMGQSNLFRQFFFLAFLRDDVEDVAQKSTVRIVALFSCRFTRLWVEIWKLRG